ncbi:hypothetical protein Pint_03669 [Pistacia integerrima]|uniref:Uncharacterized protein n=1 Tax=Pistacia integerrima TaxID=434235 RepID=A0ACC0Z4X8_9ROSI|nr:hypothetical protein Pint_03669 [Pistacia integerrima]
MQGNEDQSNSYYVSQQLINTLQTPCHVLNISTSQLSSKQHVSLSFTSYIQLFHHQTRKHHQTNNGVSNSNSSSSSSSKPTPLIQHLHHHQNGFYDGGRCSTWWTVTGSHGVQFLGNTNTRSCNLASGCLIFSPLLLSAAFVPRRGLDWVRSGRGYGVCRLVCVVMEF